MLPLVRCPQVQEAASGAFGPILERAAKAERLRGVLALLRRFQGLFAMPQRISAAAAARDYEQVGVLRLGGWLPNRPRRGGCCNRTEQACW
jgi:hypothetical protein